jgi:hypothetical protein
VSADELLTTGEMVMLACGHAVKIGDGDPHERDALLWCFSASCDGLRKQWWHVGDGATLHYFTDAHAHTVTRITRTTITIQRDVATGDPNWVRDFSPGGFMGHTANDRERSYTYAADPNGTTRSVRLTGKGWRSLGQTVSRGRREFYDSNF